MRRIWALIPVFLFGMAAHAQDKPCTPAESAAAEKAVDRVVNWEQLYKAYLDYRHCDKGTVEEVFTEALLRCIVEWKGIDGLAKPMEKDSGYRAFIVRHLASPQAKADADSVYSRAKMSCPKGLDGFCAQIADVVKPATAPAPELAPMSPMSPGVPPKAPPAAAPPKK